ncbi:hypothetical protein HGM15179_014929 [Zosterops borbonicus]|uniref:Uncharacterized protein n=1 Tax=Zosterops borbonicus TaxID=364589 RepID=A0A8K1G5P6_9PASS|nr:hypothetical protein HGM15179_014929 [Zosterops borbonicus]
MGQGNPKHKYRQGDEWIESSPEKDLGALVVKKLNLTQPCALTDQRKNSLDCTKVNCGQQAEGGASAPPLQSHKIPPGLTHSALGSQSKNDVQLLEQVQRRVTKVIRGLEHFSYEDKLRELGNILRRPYGTFHYLEGPNRRVVEALCTKACSDRTRGNGFKLTEGRFGSDTRKKVFV